MKSLIVVVTAVFLATGCASDPGGNDSFEQKVQRISQQDAALLPASKKPLSDFSDYSLEPMTFALEIMVEDKKLIKAREIEQHFRAKVEAVLGEWRNTTIGSGGRLLIQPHIQRLRVISSGARVFAGALAGDSFVALNVKLIDEKTGDIVGDVIIDKRANAWAGSWSIGSTDRNLNYYIVAIARQYLLNNY